MEHQHILDRLENFVKADDIPHIIFYGEPHSGKKTIINKLISLIYNEDKAKIRENVIYINCANHRDIQFIRDDFKNFVRINANGVKFKTVVLLHGDHLSIEAQSAMRRCIELFSTNTRFFLMLMQRDKLMTPILSRFCQIYVPFRQTRNVEINLSHSIDIWFSLALLTPACTTASLILAAEQTHIRGLSAEDFVRWACLERVEILFQKLRDTCRNESMLIYMLFEVYKDKEMYLSDFADSGWQSSRC